MIARCPPTYGHTYIHVCLEADQEDFLIHNQTHLILCPPNSNSGLGGDSSRRRNGLNEEEMIFCEGRRSYYGIKSPTYFQDLLV